MSYYYSTAAVSNAATHSNGTKITLKTPALLDLLIADDFLMWTETFNHQKWRMPVPGLTYAAPLQKSGTQWRMETFAKIFVDHGVDYHPSNTTFMRQLFWARVAFRIPHWQGNTGSTNVSKSVTAQGSAHSSGVSWLRMHTTIRGRWKGRYQHSDSGGRGCSWPQSNRAYNIILMNQRKFIRQRVSWRVRTRGKSESSGPPSSLFRFAKHMSRLQFLLCNESLAKSAILVNGKKRKVMFIEHLLCAFNVHYLNFVK